MRNARVGDTAWYIYRIPGSAMTGQVRVKVLEIGKTRVKVEKECGKTVWVSQWNLRPTN